jgi:uncharacterized protein YabE (DUF348 family)
MLSGVFFVASVIHAQEPAIMDTPQPIVFNEDDIWLTIPKKGNTVGEALNNSSIKWSEHDWLTPSADTPIKYVNNVFLSRERTVHIVVGDEKPRDFTSYRATVSEALNKTKIALSEIDKISPPRDTFIRDGDTIKITRITEEKRVEEERLDPPVKWKDDSKILLGEEKVIEEGKPKITAITVRIHSENGEETSRKVIKKEVKQEAVAKVIVRGTKVVVLGVETGRASWYGANPKTTAHKTLPFGTKLRVTNLETGKTTMVTVADRGPYAAGRIVDLSTDAFKAIAPLWQGTIPVKAEQLL